MLKVNVISESAFTVGGHGVHSAYIEQVAMLRRVTDVTTNLPCRADIQHAHTIGPYAMSALMTGRRRVVTAHLTAASMAGSLRGHRYWTSAFTKYLRAFYNRADAILAVSPAVKGELVRMGTEPPVYIVPNTVNVAAIQARITSPADSRARLSMDLSRFTVLGVGQVQPRKDISAFVECARAIPEASFYWVGGIIFGPLADSGSEMRRLIENAPSNLVFTGPLPRTIVFRYLSAADLFFLPSVQENCPMAVLEAAATNTPILLRNLSSHIEQFGTACTYGNDRTFSALINEFMDNKDLLARQSANAAHLAEKFDSSANVDQLLKIYSAVSSLPR